ncbi:MAG TPA: septal ring lytic transglycosylase RlpA family protein [bacterium]|nr:septal ring lytic transglycosylase RlpA family protein [bacterium]
MKKLKFFLFISFLCCGMLLNHNVLADSVKIPMDYGILAVEKGKSLNLNRSLVTIQVANPTQTINVDWALYMHYGYSFPSNWRPVSQVFEWNSNLGATIDLRVAPIVAGVADINTIKKLFYFDENQQAWLESADFSVSSLNNVNFKVLKPGKYVILANDMMSIGDASWYKYKNCLCAASPDYPKGSKLKVTDLDTGKSIVVTVNDWGPERDIFPNRVIDLDVVAFEALGWSLKHGILKNIEVVPLK